MHAEGPLASMLERARIKEADPGVPPTLRKGSLESVQALWN